MCLIKLIIIALTFCNCVCQTEISDERIERTQGEKVEAERKELNQYENTCLMNSVCNNKYGGVTRKSPCYNVHSPINNITDDDFYDLLTVHCPHMFDSNGELLHPICCSPDQEESITRLIQSVDLIKRGCPSCAINTKKYFCNLYCYPNQNELIRVEKKLKNTGAIVNITYFIDEQFAKRLFHSCKDVKLFGANLLDQKYICGEHKRSGCDPKKFLTIIGSVDQMPMIVQPRITSKKQLTIGGKKFAPMKDQAYYCHEQAPGEEKCTCDNCEKRCQEVGLDNHKINNNNNKEIKSKNLNNFSMSFADSKIRILLMILCIFKCIFL